MSNPNIYIGNQSSEWSS